MVLHERRAQVASSFNWSGYAVETAAGTVTHAKGSWIVPAIPRDSCAGTNQYASFWVGIDGFNSNTVEQIGTDSDCQNGQPTYYAWYEFYPRPGFIINSLKINPGDIITAEVGYLPSTRQFTVSLTDVTTGQRFSTSTRVGSANRSSAEWIAEAPSGAGGVLPLADFGTVDYGYDYTTVVDTCDATVSGTTGPIGKFGSQVVQIKMVSSSGVDKAVPSDLSPDGTSFFDQWFSSGP
jgi:hypothetical protein